MSTACPRLFEVEALRDGRLTGTERANFERHLATCVACAYEAKELRAVAHALHTSYPTAPDDLHVRRERRRLLAAFDRAPIARESSSLPQRVLLALAAITVTATWWILAPRLLQTSEPAPNSAIVHANGQAVWSRRLDPHRDRIVLERGALRIHVMKAPGKLPLLVVLPDGELEDTGTTFSVAAEAGRTTHVTVEDGSVLLRIRGQPPVSLAAGESWTPASPVQPPASAPLRIEPHRVHPSPTTAEPAPPYRAPTPPSSASAPEDALASDASNEFRAAVEALNGGASTEAATLFTRFLAEHPRDPRAEDAAYLRVLALRKSGNDTAMRSAAREYLRRYPSGFRRSEVERLAAQ